MTILNLLVNVTQFSKLNSYEIEHLAIFFTSETFIYFHNGHRVLFLRFPQNVLLVPQNWLKNQKSKFCSIFVQTCHNSNFYEANQTYITIYL